MRVVVCGKRLVNGVVFELTSWEKGGVRKVRNIVSVRRVRNVYEYEVMSSRGWHHNKSAVTTTLVAHMDCIHI